MRRQPQLRGCGSLESRETACDNGPVRTTASILHLDLDAFFASVEQRDKPSLRGKPVVVGGVGARGVVSTASYEARKFGVRSAMSGAEARARCPNAAFLAGRFRAYRAASETVMACLRELSEKVEPLSLDEAFVDLEHVIDESTTTSEVTDLVERLRAEVERQTGGLTCSVGLASSKFMAKVASELNKPNGFFIVTPGTEMDVLGPLGVDAIVGVGPATRTKLEHVGITKVHHVWSRTEAELVDLIGTSAGASLYRLSRGIDPRRVDPHREAKSVSVEDTFERDLTDRGQLTSLVDSMARKVARRLRASGQSGRTVTVKIRYRDFSTLTRSTTIAAPTDQPKVVSDLARALLDRLDVSGGVRLLGVGVSGLADWVQEDLFFEESAAEPEPELANLAPAENGERKWAPGADVHHAQFGDGWVWGSGMGIVTVRFETADSPTGPIVSLAVDDPELTAEHGLSAADDTVTS